jgi:hypothetical protein
VLRISTWPNAIAQEYQWNVRIVRIRRAVRGPGRLSNPERVKDYFEIA